MTSNADHIFSMKNDEDTAFSKETNGSLVPDMANKTKNIVPEFEEFQHVEVKNETPIKAEKQEMMQIFIKEEVECEVEVFNEEVGREDTSNEFVFKEESDLICKNSSQYRSTNVLPNYEGFAQECDQESEVDELNIVNNSNLHVCDICNKVFASENDLCSHKLTHEAISGNFPSPCEVRGVSYSQKKCLDAHMAANHKIVLKFNCEVCDKSFPYKRFLDEHMKTHLPKLSFMCDLCGRSFSRKSNLIPHMATHTYPCEICTKSFTQKEYLNRHMISHSDDFPFSCEICKRSFSRRCHFNRHMIIHKDDLPFTCDICNKSFSRKEHLNRHTITHSSPVFPCEVCNKSFNQKEHFDRHMIRHTGERFFSCDVCGKSFSQRSHFNRHVLTHKGDKSFICEVCKKSFSQKDNLKRHKLTHRFACEMCDKSFSQTEYLDLHMAMHATELSSVE